MIRSNRVLTLILAGSNPNIAFYACKLQETKSCAVTLVSPTIQSEKIRWETPKGEHTTVTPAAFYHGITDIPSNNTFDVVILSSTSLQSIQTDCAMIAPYLSRDTVILIESTGFVSLEPFVRMSFPDLDGLTICSIMNEADVRQLDGRTFLHTVRENDNRIYFGTSSEDSNVKNSVNFGKVYKLLQLIQQDSRGEISLLKSTVPKEFTTYQWKLALPRIVFNPLSIIFESEFPEQLADQILCKPLITGTINEIFKIIKRMDCKLVRGSENEANLFKHWSQSYPRTSSNRNYVNSTPMFYAFYNQLDLNIDLLLLQPILLADDHGIRTPYLENLYSLICQLSKMNEKESRSLFFNRKSSLNEIEASKLDLVNAQYHSQLKEIRQMTDDILKLEDYKKKLNAVISEQEAARAAIESDLSSQSLKLQRLNIDVENQQRKVTDLERVHGTLSKDIKKLEDLRTTDRSTPATKDITPERAETDKSSTNYYSSAKSNNNNNQDVARDSIYNPENLEDLRDIALYGAGLEEEAFHDAPNDAPIQNQEFRSANGSAPPQSTNPTSLQERESILQQKERELATRELALHQRQQANGSLGPQRPIAFKSGSNGPVDPRRSQLPGELQLPPFVHQGVNSQNPQMPMPHAQNGNYQHNGHPGPNGYFPPPLDQAPPHGLPPNGLPTNGMPNSLRGNSITSSTPRYGAPPQQMMAPMKMPNSASNGQNRQSRLGSINTAMNPYFDPNQPYPPQGYGPQNQLQPQFQMQYGGQYQNQYGNPMYGNYTGPDPSMEMRSKPHRRQAHRSTISEVGEGLSALDMGGRGGMPMPGVPNTSASSKNMKNRSSVNINLKPIAYQNNPASQRRSVSTANVLLSSNMPYGAAPPFNQNQQSNTAERQSPDPQVKASHLQVPEGSSASNSTNSVETPNNNEDFKPITLLVPPAESEAKPLGGVTTSNNEKKEKKKKGLFKRKG